MGPHLAIGPFLPKAVQSANNSAQSVAKTGVETGEVCTPEELAAFLSDKPILSAVVEIGRRREREVDAAVRADIAGFGLDPANPFDVRYYRTVTTRSGCVSPSLLRVWREQHA